MTPDATAMANKEIAVCRVADYPRRLYSRYIDTIRVDYDYGQIDSSQNLAERPVVD